MTPILHSQNHHQWVLENKGIPIFLFPLIKLQKKSRDGVLIFIKIKV
jgi:hypothetical protein